MTHLTYDIQQEEFFCVSLKLRTFKKGSVIKALSRQDSYCVRDRLDTTYLERTYEAKAKRVRLAYKNEGKNFK